MVHQKSSNTVPPPLWTGSKGKFIWRLLPWIATRKSGRLFAQAVTRFTIESTTSTKIGEYSFVLSAANARLDSRNRTYGTKEPGTIEWIDGFAEGSILWDIGANIGLYSLYAARSRQCKVIAFEPSVFCLEFLARNIWQNNLQKLVSIVPNPLSDATSVNLLTLNSREWGESSNSFGTTLNQDGKEINPSLKYQILGITMDDAINKLGIPKPEHVKIDVDGIEPMILLGGAEILKVVQSVSIEVPTYAGAKQKVAEILTSAGLYLDKESGNQIWRRRNG